MNFAGINHYLRPQQCNKNLKIGYLCRKIIFLMKDFKLYRRDLKFKIKKCWENAYFVRHSGLP